MSVGSYHQQDTAGQTVAADYCRLLHGHSGYLTTVNLEEGYLELGVGMILDNQVARLYVDTKIDSCINTSDSRGLVGRYILIGTYVYTIIFAGRTQHVDQRNDILLTYQISATPAMTSGLVSLTAR